MEWVNETPGSATTGRVPIKPQISAQNSLRWGNKDMIQFFYNRKGKRGISTVLGVLLMVGILFTTIIPLYIYVNAVNNYYDRTVVDMRIADQERSMEELEVYAFGSSDESDDINVLLVNRGSMSLEVVRIWVMRTDLQKTLIFTWQNETRLPLQLIASNQTTIENLVISILENDTVVDYFNIYVTTARGNKFPSKTNPLHHNGGWVSGSAPPWIHIIIRSGLLRDDYEIEAVCLDSGKSYNATAEKVYSDLYTIMTVNEFGVYNVTAINTFRDALSEWMLVEVKRTNLGVALAYFNDQ